MMRVVFALRFCLALSLALVSVHQAVARAESGTLTWVELCQGPLVTTVALDGSGTPVSPHQPCPDCVIAAAVVLPGVAGVPLPGTRLLWLARQAAAVQWLQGPVIMAQARGPPLA
ncbi:hypothetical protein [Tabrizicola sp.]|uniref:hypothetical protein n=1 Tax=Tabrizicola sp. TaxID=2005166 RepID=UPI00286D405E|nr:hypothetical protein [Tabrizicola sp.]